MISIAIHRVTTLELTNIISSEISTGMYWRRKLIVTDDKGNRKEITLFADTEEPMEIKEKTE